MIWIVFVNKTTANRCNPYDCETGCCNLYGKCTKTVEGIDCLEGYTIEKFDEFNQNICIL
jgi:hypothetical protein